MSTVFDLEARLRHELAARAADIAPTPDPEQRAYAGIASARRRRGAVVAAGVAAVLAVVLVAAAVTVAPWREDPPTPAPLAKEALGGVAEGDVLSWPVRGSLSEDADYLAGATARIEAVGRGLQRIVYAGDVGGTRIVLAVVAPQDQDDYASQYVLGLTGPRGAEAQSLEPGTEVPMDAGIDAFTWAAPARGATTSWVVLAPSAAATIQSSPMPSYDETGAPQRTWRIVSLSNGVAAGEMATAQAVGVRVRVWTEPDLYSRPAYDGPLAGAYFDPGSGSDVEPGATLTEHLGAADVSNLASGVAAQHGVSASRVDAVVQWQGRIDTYTWALVVVTRLPDGSAFQSVRVKEELPDGSGTQSDVIDGRPVPRRTAESHPAVWLDVGEDGAEQRVFLVAPGARNARLLGGDAGTQPREQLAAVTLRDGVGSLVLRRQDDGWLPVEWAVETTTAAGDSRVWPVNGRHDQDPLDLRADW